MEIKSETDSDCEVIIHLYLKYGIEQTLQMLDGVFAFILYDTTNQQVYVARDPYGVRPLYHLFKKTDVCSSSCCFIGFASELKCLSDFNTICDSYLIQQFTPGTYSVLNHTNYNWSNIKQNIPYFIPTFSSPSNKFNWSNYFENIADNLIYTSEKTLKEAGDKISADLKKEIEAKIEELKKAKDSDNIEDIKNDLV